MLIHFIFIALYLLVWGVNIVQVKNSTRQMLVECGCTCIYIYESAYAGMICWYHTNRS